MTPDQAILAFAALAQPTRLEVFRHLGHAEATGVSAGELARAIAVPANTLSAHLKVMTRAGLVHGERKGRTIFYRARVSEIGALVGFLLKDCCQARADICTPVIEDIAICMREKIK